MNMATSTIKVDGLQLLTSAVVRAADGDWTYTFPSGTTSFLATVTGNGVANSTRDALYIGQAATTGHITSIFNGASAVMTISSRTITLAAATGVARYVNIYRLPQAT